jgi:hypothetical protein
MCPGQYSCTFFPIFRQALTKPCFHSRNFLSGPPGAEMAMVAVSCTFLFFCARRFPCNQSLISPPIYHLARIPKCDSVAFRSLFSIFPDGLLLTLLRLTESRSVPRSAAFNAPSLILGERAHGFPLPSRLACVERHKCRAPMRSRGHSARQKTKGETRLSDAILPGGKRGSSNQWHS